MDVKIKWRVDAINNSRYGFFKNRKWPSAFLENGEAFFVNCRTEYSLHKAQSGLHEPLELQRRYSFNGGTKFLVFNKKFATLTELKEFVAKYVAERK